MQQAKTILITGASSGMGALAAVAWGKKGYNVIVTARRVDKLEGVVKQITEAGGKAIAVPCDVSVAEQVKNMFKVGEETYGKIDYVFSNAGYEGGTTKQESWEGMAKDNQMVIDINLMGSACVFYEAISHFKKHPGGNQAIVLVSSVAAVIKYAQATLLTEFSPFPVLYAMSKSAIDALVRLGAGQVSALGIRVFGVNPAVYDTEMVQKAVQGNVLGDIGMGTADDFAKFNPLFPGKAGDAKHIGDVVIALFEGTSGYKSGDSIVCDHDVTFHAHEMYKDLALSSTGAWNVDKTKLFDVTGLIPKQL